MLDRLIDFVVQFLYLFRFGVVVDQYEVGVILRLGKLRKVLGPGFHWMLPFAIESVLTDRSVPTATDLPMQFLVLACGKVVAVGPVVTFRTNDAVKFLLESDDAESALRDSARGTVREVLSCMTWKQLVSDPKGVEEILTRAVRKMAWRWGIEVTRVALSDLAPARVLRLITGE